MTHMDPYEEYDQEEEPDGQLLLEIIRKEEDRDLRELVIILSSLSAMNGLHFDTYVYLKVKRFRDQCRQQMPSTKGALVWGEQQERSVIDYVKAPNKVALFVSQQTGLRFDYSVVGQIHGSSSRPTCFFIKIEREPEPLLRPGQFDSAVYSACLVRGTSDLPRHVAKVAFYLERQALTLCPNRLKGDDKSRNNLSPLIN